MFDFDTDNSGTFAGVHFFSFTSEILIFVAGVIEGIEMYKSMWNIFMDSTLILSKYFWL